MKIIRLILIVFICILSVNGYAQLTVGPYYSTFHVPAGDFRIGGLGLDIENRGNKTSFGLTASFFTKQLPTDSIQAEDNAGNPYYARYIAKYGIILLSFTGKAYLSGSNMADDAFSIYIGGGGGYAGNTISTVYDKSTNIPDQTAVLSTFTFDFLAGADYKIVKDRKEVFKFFIQGKANLGLRFIIDGQYDTAIPLITNFQAGILYPLAKYQKTAAELY